MWGEGIWQRILSGLYTEQGLTEKINRFLLSLLFWNSWFNAMAQVPESHFKNLLNWLNKSWFQWWPIVNEIEIPIYHSILWCIGPWVQTDGDVGIALLHAIGSATLYSHDLEERAGKNSPITKEWRNALRKGTPQSLKGSMVTDL